MPDWVCSSQRNLAAIALAALIAMSSNAWAEKERCVAGVDGEWLCGKNITDADAAPLPAPTQRSTPPILLIDPRRFGEADRVPVSSAQSNVSANAATSSNSAEPEPAPKPVTAAATHARASEPRTEPAKAVAAPAPTAAATPMATNNETPAADLDFSAPTSGFAVQLAVASTPRGFGALLAKLGERPKNFQQRQLKNGNWVLLLGNFSTLEAARSAIPSAIPGAFARNLADLSFN